MPTTTKKVCFVSIFIGVLIIFTLPALAARGGRKGKPSKPGHGGHHGVTTYEGSATCMKCHAEKATEVFHSEHYQWAGKLGAINDFCTYPDFNFLFPFQAPGSTAIDNAAGCATCHVGFGPVSPPPFPATPTASDLQKIDCLMCHSDTYNHVGKVVNGKLTVVPDAASQANMITILSKITKPSRAACLKCHAKAGGGDGVKQGDLHLGMANTTRDVDVHMGVDGANMSCLDCHKADHHRIAGKGNDLRIADLNVKVDCSNCHGTAPHGSSRYNKHAGWVHCTACHIPTYARVKETETFRDLRFTELRGGRYEPVDEVDSDLTPEYLWFNGQSYFYKFGEPVNVQNGGFLLAGPQPAGERTPGAKIHPFKVHEAVMGLELFSQRLIPVKSKILWETGDSATALVAGAKEAWGLDIDPGQIEWATAKRYLALYHQVAPKEQAQATCSTCHARLRD